MKNTKSLIENINQFTTEEVIFGAPTILKPIPEMSELGVLDPRFYKKIKSLAALTQLVPDKYLRVNPRRQIIEGLKKGFDLKKSKTITSKDLRVDQITIRGKDNNLLPLRIYHPFDKNEKTPILYYIHGGGFFSGNLDVCDETLRYISENYNILIFSIDYRLAPQNPYPKGHEDCYEGFKWVVEHADRYLGDTNKVFISGDSAGGNLAHYCVVKDIEEKKFKAKGQFLIYPTLNLSGVADENAVWDISKYEINEKQKAAVLLSIQLIKNGGVEIMNNVLQTDVDSIYTTPYLYDGHDLPPTVIGVGEFDYLKVENLAYIAKLHNTGVSAKAIVYKGLGHGFSDFIGNFPQSEDLADEIGKFVLQHSNKWTEQVRKYLLINQKNLQKNDDEPAKRKYNKNLIPILNKKSYVEVHDQNEVIVKPIPNKEYEIKILKHMHNELKAQEIIINLATDLFMKFNFNEKTIEELRKGFNEVKSIPITSTKIEIEDVTIKGLDENDIPLRIYHPIGKEQNIPVYYFIHGGSFVAGTIDVVEQFVKLVVEKFNVLAFSIDYRVAPENPFPKGHEDCYEGLKWIYEHAHEYGGNSQQLFISGDSAGGNLAQYCTTKTLEDNIKMIQAQMLFYPSCNIAELNDKHIEWSLEHFEVDDKLHEKEIQTSLLTFKKRLNEFMCKALKITSHENDLSPYLSPRKDLPPTLLAVGEYDFLKIECLSYMAKLHEIGIKTKTIYYKGLTHGFIDSTGIHPQSEDLANEVGQFMMDNLGKEYKY